VAEVIWIERKRKKYRIQGECYISEDEKYILYKEYGE
jgi:hypothetical protein